MRVMIVYLRAGRTSIPCLPGCNAWAHCDPETSPECEALGVSRQCWLMYIPLSQLTDAEGKAADAAADTAAADTAASDAAFASSLPFPTWKAGKEVPWWGGVIDPDRETLPPPPTGVEVKKKKNSGGGDPGMRCVEWDPPPPIAAPAAVVSAVTNYIIRTTVERGGRPTDAAADAAAAGGEKNATLIRASEEHSARLPTQLCQCNGWKIPVPDDDGGGDDDADVLVTVRIVAENEAGRSSPAEASFSAPRSELVRWNGPDEDDAMAEWGEDCPELGNAPLTPPRGVTVRRIPESDGTGVLVNWSAPLFESDIDAADDAAAAADDAAAEETRDGKMENNGESGAGADGKSRRRRRRVLLQEGDSTTDDDDGGGGDDDDGGEPSEGKTSGGGGGAIGYQVTWVSWNEEIMPSVDPPVSVVLSSEADDVRRFATSPCGEGGSGGDEDVCFYAGFATSLRLEGLSADSSFAFAVRALTPGRLWAFIPPR